MSKRLAELTIQYFRGKGAQVSISDWGQSPIDELLYDSGFFRLKSTSYGETIASFDEPLLYRHLLKHASISKAFRKIFLEELKQSSLIDQGHIFEEFLAFMLWEKIYEGNLHEYLGTKQRLYFFQGNIPKPFLTVGSLPEYLKNPKAHFLMPEEEAGPDLVSLLEEEDGTPHVLFIQAKFRQYMQASKADNSVRRLHPSHFYTFNQLDKDQPTVMDKKLKDYQKVLACLPSSSPNPFKSKTKSLFFFLGSAPAGRESMVFDLDVSLVHP